MTSFLGVWSGPWWLVVTAYVGTGLVAGLVVFVTATLTGVAEWVGALPGRVRARNERILTEREARQ